MADGSSCACPGVSVDDRAFPRPSAMLSWISLIWPVLRWRITPWIIEHFPPHLCYVELCDTAASVLLRKLHANSEVYNDLDDAVVALFRVSRDRSLSKQLISALYFTFSARMEDRAAQLEEVADPVERVWRITVRRLIGYGSDNSGANYIRPDRENPRP